MTEYPTHLSIASSPGTGLIDVTVTANGEHTTISMQPADAALAAGKLLAEAMRHFPAETEFPATLSQPERPTAKPTAPHPSPTPASIAAAQEPVNEEEDDTPPPGPVSVPRGYEGFLDPEVTDWKVTRSAESRGTLIDVSPEQMIEAASYPDRVEYPGDTVHAHIRDGVSVLIPNAEPNAIIGVTRVAASREQPERRAPSGGPGRKMPDGDPELRRMLTAHGFEVRVSKNHPKITHPDHPGVTVSMAGTASDYHSNRNLIALVRRKFGVDITQQPR